MSDRDTKKNEIRERCKLFHHIWEPICTSFYAALLTAAQYLLHHHTYRGFTYTADDLANAAVIRVLRYCPDPSLIENKRAYLLKILKMTWYDLLRMEMEVNMVSVDESENESSALQLPDLSPGIQGVLERKELIQTIKNDPGPLTSRETTMFKLFLEDKDCYEISEIMDEDVRIIRHDLNKLRTKIVQRFKKRFGANG